MILVAGGAVGYWLYGDRLPSVLSRAASGAADRVTDVAARASERYDSNDGPRIASEEAERRRKAREARDRTLGWVTIAGATASEPSASPSSASGSSASRAAALDRVLAPLRSRNGPAYVSLSASQIAGVLAPLMQQLPPSAQSVQLALDGEQLLVRAVVSLRDVAGTGALGTVLGGVLDGTDTLSIAGPVEPVRPGVAQFRVRELRLKGVDVPPRFIPPLVRTLRQQGEHRLRARRERTGTSAGTTADRGNDIDLAGLADDGLPIPLPASVSDVRVVNGKLTLYRATPAPGSASTKPTP